jgi:hypothetical protein
MPEVLTWQESGDTHLCDLGPYRLVVWRSWKGDAVLWLVQDRLNGTGVLRFAHTAGGIDEAKQEALGWAARLGGWRSTALQTSVS